MFDEYRKEQLEKQIIARETQIKEIKKELSEMQEELDILVEIETTECKIAEIEKEISKMENSFDSFDWGQALSDAYLDKNWHAARVAEKHLREENYLQKQINENKKEKLKLQEYLKALEEKKKAIFQKKLLEDSLDQAEPMPQ